MAPIPINAKNGCKKMNKIDRLTELRTLYLEDLEKGVDYDGKKTRKRVYNVDAWKVLPITFITEQGITANRLVDHTKDHNTWLWADQHFFHNNIIKYCDRPYPTMELMNQCLIGNYNNVVKPDDVCIWVGDVGFAGDDKINETLAQLNGYKILVIGNHDFHHGKVRNLNFHEIHLLYLIEDNGAEIVLTHYPMDNLPLKITNVHGHLHQKITGNDQHINVAVERIGYKPINLKEILPIAHKRAEMYE